MRRRGRGSEENKPRQCEQLNTDSRGLLLTHWGRPKTDARRKTQNSNHFYKAVMSKTIDQRQREIRHQLNLRRNQQFGYGVVKGGKRPDLDYGYFRCTWEANYARYLTQFGIEWEYEPKTFWFEKHKSGTVNYTPDFHLPANEGGEEVWVEVKGQFDSKSKTKLRRFKKYFPEEFKKLIVVCGDIYGKSKTAKSVRRFLLCTLELPPERIVSYTAIARKYKSIIGNWER